MEGFEGRDTIALDFIATLLYFGTLAHCVIRGKLEGICVVLSATMIGLLFEYMSTQIGDSHCHSTSQVMLFSCVSLKSVLYYAPWLYTCYFVGWKVPMSSKFARYLLLGFLHPLYSLAYEITGNLHGWFRWSDSNYLSNRFVGVPILTIMFHFFTGIAFSFSRTTARDIVDNYKGSLSLGSRIHQLPVVVQLAWEVVANAFITTMLTPIVTLLPLVLWGVPVSLESSKEEDGEEGKGVLMKALSLATVVASVAPTMTDSRLGLLNRSALSTLRSSKRGLWSLTALLWENEESQRDVFLLSIPYVLFLFMLVINLQGMYMDFLEAQSWAAVAREVVTWPRIAVLVTLQMAWLVFGYFNICGVLEPHGGKVPSISFALSSSPTRSTRGLYSTPPRSGGSRSRGKGGKKDKAEHSAEKEIMAHLSPGRRTRDSPDTDKSLERR